MERYRGRFAPSPTGPLHFGSLVAAVGSYLEARARRGEWLVRMEDPDPPRVVPGAADEILRALEACRMLWDGPVVRQSERSDAYHSALHRLRERGVVYSCACSRREIADSAVMGIEGYVYRGSCRDGLPPGKRARAQRVSTRGATVVFEDAAQGRIEHDLEKEIGDFVLYRADRVYAYQLAVVMDDAEQNITDVVRGADLLASTPRQIHLQRLLGLATPRYVHLPVAVNEAGEKLSKQTLAAPVNPAHPVPALAAALTFLGQCPPTELGRESLTEFWDWALKNWDLARVPRVRTAPVPPIGDQG
ncbi:MAG: tRNA glutamyl-Q(34) synthetase GluQRS [Betaproteobacteria bacterium]|nr:tRNA glutamyl-Q(34) synthetase GluQRS [Betaproteobacteria bacterium]MDH3437115.1 tRNA glutamyl-Q(34) synthetase GluQRS [Betaproteobacteria bacterium]